MYERERERERESSKQREALFMHPRYPKAEISNYGKMAEKETGTHLHAEKNTETNGENTRNRITEHIHEYVQQRN